MHPSHPLIALRCHIQLWRVICVDALVCDQVKLLVEGLACRPQRVAQLWLPNLPKKFKEVVSRLQKMQETKSMVGGVLMAEASLDQEKCFALASKVAAMYKVRLDTSRQFLKFVSRF